MKVLVMDDNRILLDIIEKILLEENFEVLKTDRSDDVIELFKEYKPAIVLLDVILENLETGRLVREIKSIDDNVKVVLLSTFDRFFLKEIEEAGVNSVLRKPFKRKELVNIVKNLSDERDSKLEKQP
jgi:DNA-binding response OmpR family regulator